MTNIYESPLSTRYASDYMLNLFSQDTRYQTWRKLWVSLARAEMQLGLPISPKQVAELETHIKDIDYECVKKCDGTRICIRKGCSIRSRDNTLGGDQLLCY